MQDLKNMVKQLEGADVNKLKDLVPKIMNKIKEVGFIEVVKDDELKEFIPKMREQMANIDIEELVPLAKVVMPTIFEGMSQLLAASEEAQDELEDQDDMAVQMQAPDLDVYVYMKIEEGKFSAGEGKIDDADLKITISKETFLKMMQGESNIMEAYMSGDVKAEGELAKAMALRPLLEIIADEYGLDLGIGM